jgi:flagellar motility protein MotE (MotC chaperone)
MSAKKIMIFAGLAVVSFTATFVLTHLLSPPPPPPKETLAHGQEATTQPQTHAPVEPVAVTPKEKELDELVVELRAKLAACARKEQQLDEWEKRIRIVQQDLAKQAEDLENLRVQLVAPLNSLREAKEELLATRQMVTKQEKENLKFLAARYDKMDSASSSKILTEMCANNQADDAVKLLFYMSDRPAAKLLSEMPDKALAARLSEMIKRLKEEG